MPWSGGAGAQTFSRNTGVYAGTTAWQQTEAAGRGIRADDADTHDQDIATSLNLALKKDGGNTLSADIPAGGFGFTGLGTFSSATEASVAVASTTNVLASASLQVLATGSGATITSFGSTAKVARKRVRFDGSNSITHSSSLVCPGSLNLSVESGTVIEVESDASGNARITHVRRVGGSGLILLTYGTVAAAATLDIVLTAFANFRGLKFILSGFRPANDNVQLIMRFSTDAGSNYDAGAGAYGYDLIGEGAFAAGTATEIPLAVSAVGGDVGNASNEGVNAEISMFNQTSTAFNTRVQFHTAWMDNTATSKLLQTVGAGARLTAQDTDAVRFMFDSGNITSGNYAVYGLA